MAIYKKEENWWPKLQKGSKLNFVKVDFQKWVDEDDEEEEAPADPMGGLDFQSLMAQAGAAGGLPDMGGMGGMVSFLYGYWKGCLTNWNFIIAWSWWRR